MTKKTELSSEPPSGVDVWLRDDDEYEDDIFHWECSIVGPPDTLLYVVSDRSTDSHTHTQSHTHNSEGGIFIAQLDFPFDFPNSPPKMRFTSAIWHPNVYPDGRVCISILHPPGTDVFNAEETAEERWRPILSVEAVLLSVMSMLADPNPSSPANIDAAVMFRKDPAAYKKRCKECVRRTLD